MLSVVEHVQHDWAPKLLNRPRVVAHEHQLFPQQLTKVVFGEELHLLLVNLVSSVSFMPKPKLV